MKLNTRFGLYLFFLPLILILLVTNAHAFLITTELTSFSVELVPAQPNSTMSIEWNSYSGSAQAFVTQRTHHGTHTEYADDVDRITLEEPTSTTLDAATKDAWATSEIDNYETTFISNLGEGTMDDLSCAGGYSLSRYFKVHGDGWMVISAVHNADFETTPDFYIDYQSGVEIFLQNGMPTVEGDESYFVYEDSSDLTNMLSVRAFFNDGDAGHLSVHHSVLASTTQNPVPIPGALWLLGSGLSFLVAIKRRSR